MPSVVRVRDGVPAFSANTMASEYATVHRSRVGVRASLGATD